MNRFILIICVLIIILYLPYDRLCSTNFHLDTPIEACINESYIVNHSSELLNPKPSLSVQILQKHKPCNNELLSTFADYTECNAKIHSICFSRDGSLLATGLGKEVKVPDNDKATFEFGEIKIFDVRNPHKLKIVRTLSGHDDEVNTICFSPDGEFLYSGSYDSTINIWKISNGKLLNTIYSRYGSIRSICISPNKRVLAYSCGWYGSNGKIKFLDVSDPQNAVELFVNIEHKFQVHSLCFSHDGSYLVSGSDDRTIKFWDVSDLSNVTEFYSIDCKNRRVFYVCLSPDGKYLSASLYGALIKIWDVSDLNNIKEVYSLKEHTNEINSLSFSPDCRYLVSGSEDWSFILWDITNGCMVMSRSYTAEDMNVCFSPIHNYFVSGSQEYCTDDYSHYSYIRIWDIEDDYNH